MVANNAHLIWQDATLMTWGGLRGAVGLALAIQVRFSRNGVHYSPKGCYRGHIVIFHIIFKLYSIDQKNELYIIK